MKRLVQVALTATLLLGGTSVFADAAMGQKYYLKTMKPKTGYNGTKFAGLHTQEEWRKLFSNDGAGFIEEFSKKHPELEGFLKSEKFKGKIMEHIRDFAIEYAKDSGNVPSC